MTACSLEQRVILEDLDYQPPCEANTIYTANGTVIEERPNRCTNPAEVIITIHSWREHEYRSKFFCLECLSQVSPECYAGCGAPNVTTVQTIGKT